MAAIQSSLSQAGSASMASSVRENHFGAANCIDGVTDGTDGSWADGWKFCGTDTDLCPWLAIDYGKTVTVKRVEMFNRMHSCCGSRTQNVDVRISDELPASASQMFSGGALLGHFAGPGTHGQHITISGQTFKLRNSASSFHWLSSSIFNVCLFVRCPASVTPPLISTI